MATTIDRDQLQANLDQFLARAAAGERILVRDPDGTAVALGPAGEQPPATQTATRRRRYRAHRTIASVFAEDRGA